MDRRVSASAGFTSVPFFILSSSEQFARLLVPISMKGYAC